MTDRPPSTRSEIVIAILTGVILLTYGTSDYFLWKQGRIGKDAADAATSAATTAKQALKDSEMSGKNILFEMQNQTKAMQSLGEAATSQAQTGKQSARDTLAQMTAQSMAMRDAANQAKSQTKTAQDYLQTTISNYTSDQRAWVGIEEYKITQQERGKDFKAYVYIVNTGRTPALHVHEAHTARLMEDSPFDKVINSLKFKDSEHPIAPQGRLRIDFGIPSAQFSRFMPGNQELFLLGRIEYRDLSGTITGHTAFCLFLPLPSSTELQYCQQGNDMN